MHDRVTICGGVLGGHPRLVADEILALSVANCRSTRRYRDAQEWAIKKLNAKSKKKLCRCVEHTPYRRVPKYRKPLSLLLTYLLLGGLGQV